MNCPLCSAASPRLFAATKDARKYWRCGECCTVWLDFAWRLRPEDEKKYYGLHENRGPTYLNYLLKTAGPVIARVAKGAKGLDFGCGPTEGMKELLSPMGFSVVSYDPFFFPGELPKNHYDFLLCNEVAEHFYSPILEFERIDSVLKHGAICAIRSQLLADEIDFEHWYYRRDPTHVVFFHQNSVHWLAKRLGWEPLEIESPLWLFRKT